MVVPGTPESTLAYELALGQLQPLRTKRATGGIRVTLDNFGLSGMVLFAQDPLIVDAVTHLAARLRPASGRVGMRPGRSRVSHRHRDWRGSLPGMRRRRPPLRRHLDAARKSMQACNGAVDRRSVPHGGVPCPASDAVLAAVGAGLLAGRRGDVRLRRRPVRGWPVSPPCPGIGT